MAAYKKSVNDNDCVQKHGQKHKQTVNISKHFRFLDALTAKTA